MGNINELSSEANITNESLDFKASFLRDIKGNVTVQEYSENKIRLSNDVSYEIRKLDNKNNDTEVYAIFRNDVKLVENIIRNTNFSSTLVTNDNFFSYVPQAHIVTTNWTYSNGTKYAQEIGSYLIGDKTNYKIQDGIKPSYGTEIRTINYHSNDEDNKTKSQYVTISNLPLVLDNMFYKSGYTIAGYSTTPDGGLEYFVGDTIPDTVDDLYAMWRTLTNNITIVFHSGAGRFDNEQSTNTVSFKLTSTSQGVQFIPTEGSYQIPHNPSASSVFAGWSVKADGSGTIFKSLSNIGDHSYDNLQLYATYSTSDCQYADGTTFNSQLKKIAGNTGATYSTIDNYINRTVWTEQEPDTSIKNAAHLLSNPSSSGYPIYGWYSEGTVYIWSEGKYPTLPNSADYFISGLNAIQRFDFSSAFGITDTSNVTSMANLVSNCSSLKYLDTSILNTSKCTYLNEMFKGCTNLEKLDITHFDTLRNTDFTSMFEGCTNLSELDISNLDTSNGKKMDYMFADCKNVKFLDVSSFNTSKVESMNWVFKNCNTITALDVSRWNTSKVTSFEGAFANIPRLETINMSNFNTTLCSNMNNMFTGCSMLKRLDLSNFNTKNVENQTENSVVQPLNMFKDCGNLKEIKFGTNSTFEKITIFDDFFKGCNRLASLDLSYFDTSEGTSFLNMFFECFDLADVTLTGFDTSNATNLSNMFYKCYALKSLNLSSFDTSDCESTSGMFFDNSALTTIYVSDTFVTTNVTDSIDMFNNCHSLVGGAGTRYTSAHKDKTYAVIDSSTTPGYFTSI